MMNKRIDFSHLGGFPLTQEILDFLQQSYTGSFEAIAKLAGNFSILTGCEEVGLNITNGWIVYNNEIIPLVGGTKGDGSILLLDTVETRVFDNAITQDVLFTKVATMGTPAVFNYSQLVPLLQLQNIWLPGDIKEKYVDAGYEAANFDIDGYGINKEKGWRKLSSVYVNSAGAVTVNKKVGDAEFGVVGNFGGTKTHVLTIDEMPSHSHVMALASTSSGLGYLEEGSNVGPTRNTSSVGGSQAHNNLQPYFVVLKLIKL